MTTKITEKPIRFAVNTDCNIPSRLIGDEIKLKQIILNLLGNAVKYTNEGFIFLTINGTIKEKTVILTITIADSGIGIKDKDINKLFKDFVPSLT